VAPPPLDQVTAVLLDGPPASVVGPPPPSPAVGDRRQALASLRPRLRAWARSSLERLERAPQPARAYCGPAHQREWQCPEWPPAEVVDVPAGDRAQPYRLVHDPVSGAPARDRRGALVYLPAGPGTVQPG
jgi:hypothetical protein